MYASGVSICWYTFFETISLGTGSRYCCMVCYGSSTHTDWLVPVPIVMALYFVLSDFTHFTIWCIKVQRYIFMQKCLCIYINKCIQHRMADIKIISWLWILILQPKQVKNYCFRSFSTVGIHPLIPLFLSNYHTCTQKKIIYE